ncbi:MAG TPA: ferrochelatase [Acidimicrobiales bacterium]|nr:ferrochelatase [Acidimicrobiales bacterium]
MTPTGVLVMSHGTPRSLDDLPAFYTEIRRGRPPPPELLADLERRYRAIGGLSPLNAITDAQTEGIRRALEELAPGRFVVAAGAKFASPRIEDAVACLVSSGVDRIVGVVLAPHYSAASVGEYTRRAVAAAHDVASPDGAATSGQASASPAVPVDVIPQWHLAPGLVSLLAARVRAATAKLPATLRDDPLVVFTAHSIPKRLVDNGDPYVVQVGETAAAVAHAAGADRWCVAWQSAGRTAEEWIGPDVGAVVAAPDGIGNGGVVVCPIGFVADHLEVLYDVDIELRAVAESAGVTMVRTASFNDDPAFCDVVARVVLDGAGLNGATPPT